MRFMWPVFLIAAAAAAFSQFAAVTAHEYKQGELLIDHPWARPSIGESGNGAVFLTVRNNGAGDDKLIAAEAGVSRLIEIHTHMHDGEVMRMRRVEGGLSIPPRGKVALEPGGLHIMLIGLKQKLTKGDSFPLTLIFEKAGRLPVEVTVEERQGG